MRYLAILFIVILSGCNTTVVNTSRDDDGLQTPDSQQKIRDYHTTPSDVTDHLFLALNKKDWNVVNSFYSSNARIVDINRPNAASASDYFASLFSDNEIYYIYLQEQHPTNNGIRAKAYTRRGTRSAEYPLASSL